MIDSELKDMNDAFDRWMKIDITNPIEVAKVLMCLRNAITELKRHREAVEIYQDCLNIIKNSIDPVTSEHVDEQEEAAEALKKGEAILNDT